MVRKLFTDSWLNQKIANLLGDFKEERKPEEDPSPTRALWRLCFAALIMGGLLSLLVYYFMDSPDVWVEQINLSKEKDFARCSLYEKSYCKDMSSNWGNLSYITPRRPVVCPCKNININWRKFLRFFVVYENTREYNVTFLEYDSSGVPKLNVSKGIEYETLLRNHVEKDESILTADELCNLAYYWPALNSETGATIQKYRGFLCRYMASTLLPSASLSYPISSEFLESPYLLNRETFNIQVAQRARESVLRGRMDLDIINFGNKTYYHKVYSLYADMLTRVLDRFDSEEWESYYQGALDLERNLNLTIEFGDMNPWVILLSDDRRKLQFLHPETDWNAYYDVCDPLYCKETKKMSRARQAYRAFGLLGGVTTLVLGLVTMLVWPCFALVLSWYCKNPEASATNPEDPEASFFSSTGRTSSTLALTPIVKAIETSSASSVLQVQSSTVV